MTLLPPIQSSHPSTNGHQVEQSHLSKAIYLFTLSREELVDELINIREILEINPDPHSINNVDFEEKVCKALSFTGTKVKPDDLDGCHRMKKKDKVIINFKNRKQRNNVIFKRKQLKSKGDDLLALQFG